ncbi:ChaN family lipoprotein [Anaeromyxobacter dehalogenans]|nr:ChaN family lipoprotein [Anaeromyxobacter dehalogenans]
MHRALLLAAALLAAACHPRPSASTLVAQPLAPGRAWISTVDRAHPLVGRVWDVRAGRFADEAALEAGLSGASYVLLGETHDNPDHHVLQARLVRALTGAGKRPAVAFEMLATEQQPAIDAALAAPRATPEDVSRAVRWDESGWPPFAQYRPVFAAALDARLRIEGANLPRAQIQAATRRGLEALPAPVRARIERQGPLPEAVAREMRQEMAESHCGALPASMLDPLVTGQRARDAQMAESLARTGAAGAVLITGSGHARTDRGVASYLDPGAKVASVLFREVVPGRDDPGAYAADYAGRLPFDWVVFTPGEKRPDPCAELRAHMKAKAKPAAAPPPAPAAPAAPPATP